MWKIGCMAIAVGCILATGSGRAHAASTYVLRPDFVTTPTAANESFSVILRLEGPSQQMSGYSLRLFYNSSIYTIDSATNNTNSPTAGVALYGPFPDTNDDDQSTETDKRSVIGAFESSLTGWSVPGNMALLHCTTSASFTPLDRILIKVMDNSPSGIDNADLDTYHYNDDTKNPPPDAFSWTQTYFLPVGLSSFSIE